MGGKKDDKMLDAEISDKLEPGNQDKLGARASCSEFSRSTGRTQKK